MTGNSISRAALFAGLSVSEEEQSASEAAFGLPPVRQVYVPPNRRLQFNGGTGRNAPSHNAPSYNVPSGTSAFRSQHSLQRPYLQAPAPISPVDLPWQRGGGLAPPSGNIGRQPVGNWTIKEINKEVQKICPDKTGWTADVMMAKAGNKQPVSVKLPVGYQKGEVQGAGAVHLIFRHGQPGSDFEKYAGRTVSVPEIIGSVLDALKNGQCTDRHGYGISQQSAPVFRTDYLGKEMFLCIPIHDKNGTSFVTTAYPVDGNAIKRKMPVNPWSGRR